MTGVTKAHDKKQGKVQEKLDAAGAWDLDAQLALAIDALQCPPADVVVDTMGSGR